MNSRFKKMVFLFLAVLLIMPPSSIITPFAEAASEKETVYHEDFSEGSGIANPAGEAELQEITDVVFDGNEDGHAVYVDGRSSHGDGVNFLFNDAGMEDDHTYTITVIGYVDEEADVPEEAQIYLQNDSDDDLIAETDFAGGEVFTLTGEYTVETDGETALHIQSNEEGEEVPFYIGDVLVTAEIIQEDEEEVSEENEYEASEEAEAVYHETFNDGQGAAVEAGDAQLEAVADTEFDGNEDGHALYVSGRSNDYDGVDLPFDDVGMEDGHTYTITVTGYVDEGEDVPEGAQGLLQNIDSYQGLYAAGDFIAGETFTLTDQYTVDAEEDHALRIQSNDEGETVPFYIGEILIVEDEAGDGDNGEDELEEPRDPAEEFEIIDFEDGTQGGFEARGDTEVLEVTDEANHTEDGSYSLKVTERSEDWHGPSLNVEQYIDVGQEYNVSVWVKLISPSNTELQLSTQVGNESASYDTIENESVSAEEGWVQLEGTYRYNSVGDEYVTIYVESSSSDASFYIDDVSFESADSDQIEIERDLTPIQNVYEDYFLIGNAVSADEMEGARNELLTMHHNLATAENAMKPEYAYNDEGEFDFSAADALVDQVLSDDLQMHGHVLVWHQQSRDLLHSDEDGNPLEREEALDNLRTHVQTVVEHYGEQVISWDVVNEAMGNNPPNPEDWQSSLRESGWYRAIGPDYIEEAFLAAQEVVDENEWDIKFYYNDYNDDNRNKADAIYHMVEEINERYAEDNNGELLIDGVGMQGHYNLSTNPENVRRSLENFIELGVEVGVTELDITAGSEGTLTEDEAIMQGLLYAELFQLYKEHAEHISRVTFWGLNDGSSWRSDQNPLLFDRNLQAKPAYYAVVDPETFLEENEWPERDARHGEAAFGTPEIDGEIDDIWDDAPELPINRYQTAWQGADGVGRALWDHDNLYVLVEVNDSNLDKSHEDPWEQDSIEVFLDEGNTKTPYYEDEGDGQYRVNFDNETSFNPDDIGEGFESETHITEDGYFVEVKIPFDTITPDNDTEIGFDLQINDAEDGARQSVAAWNDTTGAGFEDTSVFGVLALVEGPEDAPDNGDSENGESDNGETSNGDADDSGSGDNGTEDTGTGDSDTEHSDSEYADSSDEEAAEGQKLPETATNFYTYLMAGVLLILAGTSVYIITRRKKSLE